MSEELMQELRANADTLEQVCVRAAALSLRLTGMLDGDLPARPEATSGTTQVLIPRPRGPVFGSLVSDTTIRYEASWDEEQEAQFLAAMRECYRRARARGRANLLHGATMMQRKLGGVLVIKAEWLGRTLPEAEYISEGAAEGRW